MKTDEKKEKFLSKREIIQFINNSKLHELRKIDSKFPRLLHSLIKAPMIFILGLSGLLVGLTLTCTKFAGEIVANDSLSDEPGLVVLFLAIAGFDSLFLLFSVNLCMKYYDQIDVMPTYFAQILIWSVLCGLMLLDEHKLYSTVELIFICICSVISFIGIQILAKKSGQP